MQEHRRKSTVDLQEVVKPAVYGNTSTLFESVISFVYFVQLRLKFTSDSVHECATAWENPSHCQIQTCFYIYSYENHNLS